ncbi:uncharacterized protein PV07_12561 [Cladophialophora immunda]|uniref:Uncharacterized protein n=1 Tax=Cladophialophora immunda TaxID=569365 RepID=A0A0D2BSP7_9EURO|nr:uncharacterized protein PV07_12561 [Cladophialophora immunda]KIW22043.1 hypothetical protein PV07_12561 [Cladophialophora immunda]
MALNIVGSERLRQYVRTINWKGLPAKWPVGPEPDSSRFTDAFLSVVRELRGGQLQSVILDLSKTCDVVKVLTSGTEGGPVFSEVHRFELFWSPRKPDWQVISARRTLVESCRSLPQLLPQVRELTIGLHPKQDETQGLGSRLLERYFPHLERLTLKIVVDVDDALPQFLKRHRNSLKELTLHHWWVLAPTKPICAGRQTKPPRTLLRQLILLNRATQLDRVTLRGDIFTGTLGSQVFNVTGAFYVREREGVDEPLVSAVEEYTCHRKPFPFPKLQPYITRIADGNVSGDKDHAEIDEGDEDGKEKTRRKVHGDHTFEISMY